MRHPAAESAACLEVTLDAAVRWRRVLLRCNGIGGNNLTATSGAVPLRMTRRDSRARSSGPRICGERPRTGRCGRRSQCLIVLKCCGSQASIPSCRRTRPQSFCGTGRREWRGRGCPTNRITQRPGDWRGLNRVRLSHSQPPLSAFASAPSPQSVFEKLLCDFLGVLFHGLRAWDRGFTKGRRHGCRVSDGFGGRAVGGDLEVNSGGEAGRSTAIGGPACGAKRLVLCGPDGVCVADVAQGLSAKDTVYTDFKAFRIDGTWERFTRRCGGECVSNTTRNRSPQRESWMLNR